MPAEVLELADRVGAADGLARQADADLNAAYAIARKNSVGCDQYTLCANPEQLAQIQRLWIKYRDAWVDYAALRWPSIPADTWRTGLTHERTEWLKSVGAIP